MDCRSNIRARTKSLTATEVKTRDRFASDAFGERFADPEHREHAVTREIQHLALERDESGLQRHVLESVRSLSFGELAGSWRFLTMVRLSG